MTPAEITLINFAHPVDVWSDAPLSKQITHMVDALALSPQAWQTLPILVNPPSLNHAAILLMAELHGRMGRFPACLRIRPVKDAIPRCYEVAEIASLQMVRDEARKKRSQK